MLTKDFKEFIELLNELKVRYLLVGGHAVIYYGYVRYTGDLDIWISNSKVNAKKMVKVIDHFGFSSVGLTEKDFASKDAIIQLGYEPDRIDIMTSVEGLTFDDCYKRRVKVSIESLPINLLSKEDLKKNKKAVGRLQDLTDLQKLILKKK